MSNLHPQILELLASLSTNPPVQPWDVSIAAYRAGGEKLIGLAGDRNPHCDVRDLEIPLRGRVVKARSYSPKGATAAVPGVVYFHGGGFVRGGLESHDRLCRELSIQGALRVISVAYRLAPENTYPSAHVDAIESFCWVADRSDELRIDGEALAVAGDSSGGMLAAATAATLSARTDGASVKAQGLLCPVLDLTLRSDSVNRYGSAPLLSRAALEWCIDQYVPDVWLRESSELSPLFSMNLTSAPPAFIVNAEIDPVSDDAGRYASKLHASGVAVVHHQYAGMPHSFFLLAGVVDEGERAITGFAEGLSRLLR
ncbi:lipase [Rhodococcus opacus M213]|uniref:Lipase n=1 Tax=Rhodococcus opacus M213 TaxID=1129896 RepID=K8XWF3_RHOOP|nr:alpha/beta hydrolase [Rhodococcus opacus]EKT82547.1 lipase [Rhodococcus opacus M213]